MLQLTVTDAQHPEVGHLIMPPSRISCRHWAEASSFSPNGPLKWLGRFLFGFRMIPMKRGLHHLRNTLLGRPEIGSGKHL